MPDKTKKIYIKTFGCAQNSADSERIKAYFWDKGYEEVNDWKKADTVVINTCVIRESAENRAYGLINKAKEKEIIVTGCLVGVYDRKNKVKELEEKFPTVSQFLSIDKISFDWQPVRDNKKAALINISSGCNNFCSYCIVPMARGKEVSRPMEDVLKEADKVLSEGFSEVVLIGQNVNSYGADFSEVSLVSMGKKRFKSGFPKLLEEIARKNFKKISFVSSNPWDFSDDLIEVIAKYPNIDRLIHLPFQAGDDAVLKNMNRGYTQKEYLDLVEKIKSKVAGVSFSTDIIIGFPGENETAFEKTVEVCKKVGFEIAYLNKYSPRKGTVSEKIYKNDIPMDEKKRRWKVLNRLVNLKVSQ